MHPHINGGDSNFCEEKGSPVAWEFSCHLRLSRFERNGLIESLGRKHGTLICNVKSCQQEGLLGSVDTNATI